MYLSMRELSEVTGFSENKLNFLKTQPDFPLFEKKVTLQDFKKWVAVNSKPAAGTVLYSQSASNHLSSNGHKSYELFH
jgi:hypothetical protein